MKEKIELFTKNDKLQSHAHGVFDDAPGKADRIVRLHINIKETMLPIM